MKLVLFGKPGSGKGTIANLLCTTPPTENHVHISVGELYRQHIQQETELGLFIKPIISQGKLVDDETTNRVVKEELSKHNDYVLEGYPRTITQAEFFLSIAQPDFIINLDVADNTIIQRLLNRKRADDEESVIRHRLEIYYQETSPIIKKFLEHHQRLVTIDGDTYLKAVVERILAVLSP